MLLLGAKVTKTLRRSLLYKILYLLILLSSQSSAFLFYCSFGVLLFFRQNTLRAEGRKITHIKSKKLRYGELC